MLVQAEEANWLGNLINWLIFQFVGYIVAFFGWLFVLIGEPTFFYKTMIDLNLLPPGVSAYSSTFDS